MAKVITDKKQIDEVLARGVETIYPEKAALAKLLSSGKRIRLYCGFDPSAPSLHIGNALCLNKLAQFQKLGHEVIFLIGDFTGMIGDPTDKSAARKKLTREDVLKNAASYKEQASGYLDFGGANPAIVKYNSAWNDQLTFKDLIEVSSNFTVQQMIQRDMFQKRMEEGKPIYLHEFLYPLAQGYDSAVMDVDLEVGGNDQMFNMMAGRDLMKAVKQKEKFVMTLKLLADEAGKKMGKSEGNAVFLDQAPENMYGAVMSWTDGIIAVAFELCTKVPPVEIEEIKRQLRDKKTNPRDLKMQLAYEIVKISRGEAAARKAQEHFVKTIQNKEIPEKIETKEFKAGSIKLVDLLHEAGLAKSKGEARRLIEQGGIKLDEKVISDVNFEAFIGAQGLLLQRGKRQFLRIVKK